jgi:hypothetical protein
MRYDRAEQLDRHPNYGRVQYMAASRNVISC